MTLSFENLELRLKMFITEFQTLDNTLLAWHSVLKI